MLSYKNYIKALETIRPTLLPYVHILMSAITTLVFKNRGVCITLWLVGPSSSGKGETLRLISSLPNEKGEHSKDLFHRTDKFTENSFISNRADVHTEEARQKLDLLRKLPDKVLITPELGAFLSGHKDKLAEKFGILTRVLDGEGLSTDTGAHGHRAIDYKVEFTWIGATTEITPNKHEALSQIGGRVMTLDLETTGYDVDQLVVEIMAGFPETDVDPISNLLNNFYSELFTKFPKNSISPHQIGISKIIGETLEKLARLGSTLRSNVSFAKEKDDDRESLNVSKELPFRFAKNLHLLARASALLRGSDKVEMIDLGSVIVPIVLCSGPYTRHKVFELLITEDKPLSSVQICQKLKFGKTSVSKAIRELRALDLIDGDVHDGPYSSYNVKTEFRDVIFEVTKHSDISLLPSPLILRTKYFQAVRETWGESEEGSGSNLFNNLDLNSEFTIK